MRFKKRNVKCHVVYGLFVFSVLFSQMPILGYSQERIVNVSDFGAKGDGETDDTKSINAALLKAGKESLKLYFGKNKVYNVDTISLIGIKNKHFRKLEIIGNNATIRCINDKNNNVLNFFFIDTLLIDSMTIIGNKQQKNNGQGIGVYYSKYCKISHCKIQDCKYSGLLIAWVKFAEISNNTIFNNGDGSLPSDGITIHSLFQGIINNNIIYNNNPLYAQDGDGIQIGAISYSITGYYDPKNLLPIIITKNICYLHGRRGIKIQRSNVMVESNFLSDNAIGLSIVNGLLLVDSVQVKSNFIQRSYKGITTEGGGKFNISNIDIVGNYLMGSIATDRILLEDASILKISKNVFDKHNIKIYNKKNELVNYQNINSSNSRNVDSSQNLYLDFTKNHQKINTDFKTDSKNSLTLINIKVEETNISMSNDIIDDNFFGVFINNFIENAKINIKNKQTTANYILRKNKTLIVYSFNHKLLNYQY